MQSECRQTSISGQNIDDSAHWLVRVSASRQIGKKTKALATLADLTARAQMHHSCERSLDAFHITLINRGDRVHKEGQG
jgi:hypothetical protein